MHLKEPKGGVAGSLREIVFGLEDSFVSTLGAVTGIAAGTESTYVVILSGLVLVVVEALSMSAGSYLSSKTAMEVETAHGRVRGRDYTAERPLRAGIVMLFAYVLGGMFPLAPYLFLPIEQAYAPSIIVTVLLLFGLGAWKTVFTKRSWWKSGIEMATVSLTAAVLGFLIGRLVANVAGVSA